MSEVHAMRQFGSYPLPDNQNMWGVDARDRLAAPVPRQVSGNDFSGKGVRIGVLDKGFNPGVWGNHAHALKFAEFIDRDVFSPQDLSTTGEHGALVSRVLAGQDIGDTFKRGMAHDSKIYVADYVNSPVYWALSLFHKRGVSIINNSWDSGDSYEDRIRWYKSVGLVNYAQEDEAWQARAVLGDKQLLIWAGGNGGNPNVSWPASAPSIHPAVEKGWIAVVFLDNDGTLHSGSNACGMAANWCVSAFSGHSQLQGTSVAAPVVTATAGLVSEAFPWMDNSAIRQTLLSTADPIGDRAIYGWGRINPDRAVRGPARFDKSLAFEEYFAADFNGYRSEFFNDIDGDAGLIKSGNGTLVLWGKNTYTGETYLSNGNLELYGSIAGDIFSFDNGVLFTNGGRIGGNLTNEKVVHVAGAGLRINGNFSTQTGTLRMQFGSSVTVVGEANIEGAQLDMVGLNPYAIFVEQATVLRAAKVHGKFAEVRGGKLLWDVRPIYRRNQVDISVQRKRAKVVTEAYFPKYYAKRAAANAIDVSLHAIEQTPVAYTPQATRVDTAAHVSSLPGEPARSLTLTETDLPDVSQATDTLLEANQLSEVNNVSEAFIEKMVVLHDVSSESELGKVLDSLTGEIHATSQALGFQQAQTINRALSNRVDTLAQASQATGLWVSMLGADGKLRQRGYATAHTHMFGAQLGADHRLNNASIIGAALSWSESKARFDGLGGDSKGQSIGVSLYGRYGEQSGNYLAGRLGHDRLHNNVSRRIVVGQPERIDSNRRDGMISLYTEVGHVFDVLDAKYTPFVGAEYNLLKRGCFEETDSALALHAGSASYAEAAVSLGVHYQSSPISWAGGDTTIRGSGAYRYGNAPNLNFSAAFNGAPDASFTLQGIGLPKHSGWIGFGVATQPNSSRVSWSVNVDTQLDRRGVSNNAISAGLRYDLG